jgi:transposase
MWEAPVKNYRTSVGLDVHARSVVGYGLDGEPGEVFERRLTPNHREILEWVRSLPAPAAVTYEAGPTGFGLARLLLAAGVACLVAAPSKLLRPSGDRVKTDARDARHPHRFGTTGAPKILDLPDTAWINRPAQNTTQETDTTAA